MRNEQEGGKRSRARTVGYSRGGCLFGGWCCSLGVMERCGDMRLGGEEMGARGGSGSLGVGGGGCVYAMWFVNEGWNGFVGLI